MDFGMNNVNLQEKVFFAFFWSGSELLDGEYPQYYIIIEPSSKLVGNSTKS